jgi:PD-(D/E)XK nuclease superfamily
MLNRSSPASALGTVAHEVMGQIGGSRDFESAWNEAVAGARSTLARDWAPAAVPSPENWPGWSLTKVRSNKTFEPRAAPHQHAVRGGGRPPPLPWRERWLRHPHLPLAGKPDLVERVQGEIWVVDLKTGLKQEESTPPQRRQLLIYCALVEATLGELPSYAAVETTQNERHSFAVEPREVEGVVGDALGILA